MCAKPAKRHAPAFPTSLCGVLVFDSVSRHLLLVLLPPPHPRLSHTTLSPTIFHTQSFTRIFVNHHLSHIIFHTHTHTLPSTTIFHTQSFTHNFVTHHLSHTSVSTTSFHTPSFTHNFVTHTLSHTSLSPTIFHTHPCHPPSFTHNFVTHQLCHTPSFTHNFVTHQLCHTPPFIHHLSRITLSPTIFHTHLCRLAWQAWRMAGVALRARGWLWWRLDWIGRR